MIVSSWDRTQEGPHEAGKFTHWAAIMNIHPFSYKKALFKVMESRVVTRMMIMLHAVATVQAALWSRLRKTLGHGSLVYAIPGSI